MRPCATLAALTDSWHVFDIISQVLLKLLVLVLLLVVLGCCLWVQICCVYGQNTV